MLKPWELPVGDEIEEYIDALFGFPKETALDKHGRRVLPCRILPNGVGRRVWSPREEPQL